jgi:hypothetical protein
MMSEILVRSAGPILTASIRQCLVWGAKITKKNSA